MSEMQENTRIKRAVITGATGAIGMALLQELIASGTEVLVLCREGSVRNTQIPQHPLIRTMECSLDKICEIRLDFDEKSYGKSDEKSDGNSNEKYSGLFNQKYDVFYHFAWEGTTGSARNDMFLQNRNVKYALDAVELAARLGCETFVGAGSQAEYGPVPGKLSPETPTFPVTGYGIAKLCAGQMTRERAHQLGMKHIWVRVLSVYGPFDGKQSMVMSGIYRLIDGEIPAYTKGEQQWDYLFSRDAARAFRMVGEKGSDGVYCLGSGRVRPLREYMELIRRAVDENGQIGLGKLPYGENQVMYLCADIQKLTEDTGFLPEVSFEEGIAETVKWCREH